MDEHLKIVLQEMCSRVGAPFNDIDFTENGWFNQYSWNEKEEEYFKTWFINYLLNNKDARQTFMKFPNVQYRYISKVVDDWVFNYGWAYN